MDALFFSRRSEDHASLARAIANLDPAAFTSLANAMQTIAANADGSRAAGVSPAPSASPAHAQSAANSATASESQLAFLHAAIEAQVERLLPEGVAKNACTRVVGEIALQLHRHSCLCAFSYAAILPILACARNRSQQSPEDRLKPVPLKTNLQFSSTGPAGRRS